MLINKAQQICDAYISGSLDLSGCDLKDVTLPATVGGSLCLRGCDLKGVTLPATVGGFAMPTEADQHANLCAIAPLALAAGALDMSDVHACETTHCLAGWACHSLPNGMAMEEKLGWEMAGLMLLGPDAFAVFLESDDVARKFLEAVEATS